MKSVFAHNSAVRIPYAVGNICRVPLVLIALLLYTLPIAAYSGYVGRTEGEFSVTPLGQATYEIPIPALSGTGGMEPHLSVAYNSSSKSGLLGYGFDLTGLSVIGRVPRNLMLDSIAGEVEFSANDRFALDGQRLILSQTTGNEERVYFTEIKNFARVTAYGPEGDPTYFKVETKDGITCEYHANTRILQAGSTAPGLFWMLTRATDTSGNYFTVSYQGNNTYNEIYPIRIDYTANDAAGLQPYASVRFSYENRPDTAYTYIHGRVVRHLKCISNIGLYYGDSKVREYRMGYTVSNYHKLLTSVTETASDGTEKNPTTFQWHNAGNLTVSGLSIQSNNYLDHVTLHVGDFNGDGKDDFVALPADGSAPYNGWLLFTSTGSSFSHTANGTLYNSYIPKQVAVADFNGDGRTDMAVVSKLNSSYDMTRIYLSTGTGFQESVLVCLFNNRNFHILPVETNGDGLCDLMVTFDNDREYIIYESKVLNAGYYFISQKSTATCSQEWGSAISTDINGDGLTDVINMRSSSSRLMIADGTGGFTDISFGFVSNQNFLLGDFNGDGKDDILYCAHNGIPLSSGWPLRVSNGLGSFYFSCNVTQPFNPLDVETFVTDINCDGYSDLLTVNKTGSGQPHVFLNDCMGHFYPQPAGSSPYGTDKWNYYTGDFNGDGKTEFVCTADYHNATWKGTKLFLLPDGAEQLLSGITDGLGNTTAISYKYMSDASVHTRGTTHEANLTSFSSSWPVVYQLKAPDGLGGQHTTTYHYENALMHHRGRGVLGFSKVSSTDGATGVVTSTDYAPSSFRYVMSPVHTETKHGAQLLCESDITYTYSSYGTDAFIHLPSRVTEKSYEFTSGQLLSETETRYYYDSYGNPTQTRVTEGDITVTTSNTYDNSETTWRLGRLTASAVIKNGPEGSSYRRASFEYDTATGLMTAEVSEPNNTALGYRKTYSHDVFGNITRSTVTPLNSAYAPRTDSTAYDAKGRFITRQVNSLGHTAILHADDANGLLTSSTDANNITTLYSYDCFGRCEKDSTPVSTTRTTVGWSSGHADAPATALYYTRTEVTGQPYSIVFSDCLGRTVRTVTENAFGQKVYADVVYDARGLVWKTSEPYYSGGTPLWNVNTYDAVGRLLTQTDAAGSTMTYAYDGYYTTVTDAMGHHTTRETDSHGNLILSTDHEGNTVEYQYDMDGHCTQLTGPRTTISMQYDIRGNRIRLDDPDLGVTTSVYNAYGEMVSQTDPKGTTTYTYDLLGRLVTETRPDITVTTVYDTRFKGAVTSATASNGTSTQYYYDAYGRQTQKVEAFNDVEFTVARTYDAQNHLASITYPNGYTVDYGYSASGYATSVRDHSTQNVIWQLYAQDARGLVAQENLGNGRFNTYSYSAATGRLTATATPGIQSWTYGYDAVGNLIQRKDVFRNMTESFTYDALDRLVTIRKNGQITQQSIYDAAGNVLSRTGVGTDFTYEDGNNRLTGFAADSSYSAKWRSIEYTSFHKVSRIFEYYSSIDYFYGPDKQRPFAALEYSGCVGTMRYYVDNLYEQTGYDGLNQKCYIYAYGKAVAIRETIVSTTHMLYLHHDHLGSVTAFTDENGSLVQEMSYDAWGRRRDPSTWEYDTYYGNAPDQWGFTGHEHLDSYNLVNMGGRMYDPMIGQFLSPDPFMQAPDFTQGLNRYSYCLNNPLSLTDPSGYSWLSDNWKSLVASAVGITVSALTAGVGSGVTAAIIAGAAGGAAGALTGALLNGANIGQVAKATLTGAFWGAASGFLNFASNDSQLLLKLFKHTFSQGWLEGIQGGNMFHGFMMGAASGLGGHYIDKYQGTLGVAGEIAASAVLGGTVSELGGGKFANGAITSAFSVMFNDMMHPQGGDDDDPWLAATGLAITASAIDGPLPIGEVFAVGVIAAAAAYDLTQRVYLTYTLSGPNGQIYVGRTSGFGTPTQVMMRRYYRHQKLRNKGFGSPQLDVYIQGAHGYSAIRGREQQLIDHYGGVGSHRVANKIRGVSKINPSGRIFHAMSDWFFGNIAPYTGSF